MNKHIEIESCMDCRFSSTDAYNVKICNLGIGELGLSFPKVPPTNCPLREGEITIKLKYPDEGVTEAYCITTNNIELNGNKNGHDRSGSRPNRT